MAIIFFHNTKNFQLNLDNYLSVTVISIKRLILIKGFITE